MVVQADLTEIMYRSTRQGFTAAADAAFELHPAAKAVFEALIQKTAKVCHLVIIFLLVASRLARFCFSIPVAQLYIGSSITCKCLSGSSYMHLITVQEVDAVGLAKKVRQVVNAYNSSCGPLARYIHLQEHSYPRQLRLACWCSMQMPDVQIMYAVLIVFVKVCFSKSVLIGMF